jgi:hypothetical protein
MVARGLRCESRCWISGQRLVQWRNTPQLLQSFQVEEGLYNAVSLPSGEETLTFGQPDPAFEFVLNPVRVTKRQGIRPTSMRSGATRLSCWRASRWSKDSTIPSRFVTGRRP